MEMLNRVIKILIFLLFVNSAWSAERSVAPSLFNAPSARSAALGEALSADSGNLMSAFYNPATLATLTLHQMGFEHRTGYLGDTTNNGGVAIKGQSHVLGFFLNSNTSGPVDVFNGQETFSVEAQRNLSASFTWARQENNHAIGITAKYLQVKNYRSDELTMIAADVGILKQLSPITAIGFSILNLGHGFSAGGENFELPTQVKLGGSRLITFPQFTMKTLLDVGYIPSEHISRQMMGVESIFGPFVVRVGYQNKKNQKGKLSMGSGINFQSLSLDYSLSFLSTLQPEQRISVLYRFQGRSGNPRDTRVIFESKNHGLLPVVAEP